MGVPDWLKSSTTATYVSGLATVVSVMAALFLERYWEFRQRPSLRVQFDKNLEGDLRYLPPKQIAGAPDSDRREETWIRLRVINKGSTPARNVQVRFICTQREGDQYRESRPSLWFKISNLDAISLTIPQKFTQYFDLAYLTRTTHSTDDVSFFLPIVRGNFKSWRKERLKIEANVDRTQLDVGFFYQLYFVVVSSNADATYYRMTIRVVPKRSGDGVSNEYVVGKDWLEKRIEVSEPHEIEASEAFPAKT